MYMATWVAPSIFLSSNPPLPSLALVLDRDHELVGLVDQVRRRGEHRVGPASTRVISERLNFHGTTKRRLFSNQVQIHAGSVSCA